jgi:hypothetical protein
MYQQWTVPYENQRADVLQIFWSFWNFADLLLPVPG